MIFPRFVRYYYYFWFLQMTWMSRQKKFHFGIIELALHMTRWCSVAIWNKQAYTTKNRTNYFFHPWLHDAPHVPFPSPPIFWHYFLCSPLQLLTQYVLLKIAFLFPSWSLFFKFASFISSNFIFLRRWRSQGLVFRASFENSIIFSILFFFSVSQKKGMFNVHEGKKEGGFVKSCIVSMESKKEK